jgi:site-specific DNA-methyltransferase (adenine-specific)
MKLNTIYNMDILSFLKDIPDNTFDVSYLDPDYGVGINYFGKKYETEWDKYINWYCQLINECMRTLKETGNLFTINYPKQNSYLRVLCLDKIAYDVRDYSWCYNTNVGMSPKRFTTAHRSILHATKTKNNAFYKENVVVPYENQKDKRIQKRIIEGHKGRMPYDWFYFDLVKNVSKDKTFHSCQIPLGLFELLIKSSSNEGDDILIAFGGSGSELIKCKELKRNFVSCELHLEYYKMICDRLENNGIIKKEYKINGRAKCIKNNK